MKLIILTLAIGACLAAPVEEEVNPAIINKEKVDSNPDMPEDLYFGQEAVPSQHAQEAASLGPAGPVVKVKDMEVGQPIGLLPAKEKPEGGDLKTDASHWWYGRGWGYPSWGWGYPSHGRSYYTTRYYRPSYYSWYW